MSHCPYKGGGSVIINGAKANGVEIIIAPKSSTSPKTEP